MSKASVSFKMPNADSKHSGKVAVDYDTTGVQQGQLENKIQRLGFQITADKNENHRM